MKKEITCCAVCDDCNKLFGDTLELFLGRDSYEYLERLIHGINPKQKLRNRRRIEAKISVGKHKGVIVSVERAVTSGEIVFDIPAQIGFYHQETREFKYFLIRDIPEQNDLISQGFDIDNHEPICYWAGIDELNSLKNVLRDKGIKYRPKAQPSRKFNAKKKYRIEIDLKADRTIQRAICKIVFNYFAKVVGRSVALSDDYDGIRKFIRFDEGDTRNFVAFNQPPILMEDRQYNSFGWKSTNGYIVAAERADNNRIIGRLSLFNANTYLIMIREKIILVSGLRLNRGIFLILMLWRHQNSKYTTEHSYLRIKNITMNVYPNLS